MTSGASSARFGAAREAVTAAAAARWRLRGALVADGTDPDVARYLIGDNVVFEAVHHVPPNVAAPLEAWTSGLRRALIALAAAVVEPGGEQADHPLGGFPLAETRAEFDDLAARLRWRDGDTIEALERLQPYHLDRGSAAVAWFARLAAHHHDGGRAAIGVHVERVHVHPVSRVRRAGATVDVVAAQDASLGHGDRLVLARVRFRDAESAAAVHQELHLDVTAVVDVLGPLRRAEGDVPLFERMALVEDYLYLVAVRLGNAAADS